MCIHAVSILKNSINDWLFPLLKCNIQVKFIPWRGYSTLIDIWTEFCLKISKQLMLNFTRKLILHYKIIKAVATWEFSEPIFIERLLCTFSVYEWNKSSLFFGNSTIKIDACTCHSSCKVLCHTALSNWDDFFFIFAEETYRTEVCSY